MCQRYYNSRANSPALYRALSRPIKQTKFHKTIHPLSKIPHKPLLKTLEQSWHNPCTYVRTLNPINFMASEFLTEFLRNAQEEERIAVHAKLMADAWAWLKSAQVCDDAALKSILLGMSEQSLRHAKKLKTMLPI